MVFPVQVRMVSLLFLAEVRNREPFLDASGAGSQLICLTRYAMQKHSDIQSDVSPRIFEIIIKLLLR